MVHRPGEKRRGVNGLYPEGGCAGDVRHGDNQGEQTKQSRVEGIGHQAWVCREEDSGSALPEGCTSEDLEGVVGYGGNATLAVQFLDTLEPGFVPGQAVQPCKDPFNHSSAAAHLALIACRLV